MRQDHSRDGPSRLVAPRNKDHGRIRSHRRRRSPRARRAGAASRARTRDLVRASEPIARALTGNARRRATRGDARGARRRQVCAPAVVRRGMGRRAASRRSRIPGPLSAPVERRPATTRGDCDGARVLSARHRDGRADDGARRAHSGAAPRRDRKPAPGKRQRDRVHQPRPRGGAGISSTRLP